MGNISFLSERHEPSHAGAKYTIAGVTFGVGDATHKLIGANSNSHLQALTLQLEGVTRRETNSFDSIKNTFNYIFYQNLVKIIVGDTEKNICVSSLTENSINFELLGNEYCIEGFVHSGISPTQVIPLIQAKMETVQRSFEDIRTVSIDKDDRVIYICLKDRAFFMIPYVKSEGTFDPQIGF